MLHPDARGIFPGMPFQVLNGSMWTIPYEFHCYILVMVAGVAGLFNGSLRYFLFVAVMAALAMAGLFGGDRLTHGVAAALLGTPDRNLQLVPMFGAGVLYALFQRNISFSNALAVIAAATLTICLFFAPVVPLHSEFWGVISSSGSPSVARFSRSADLPTRLIYLTASTSTHGRSSRRLRSSPPAQSILGRCRLSLWRSPRRRRGRAGPSSRSRLWHWRTGGTTGFQQPQSSANSPHEGAT